MRTATLVIVAYLVCVVLASVWRLMPFGILRDATPELGALGCKTGDVSLAGSDVEVRMPRRVHATCGC